MARSACGLNRAGGSQLRARTPAGRSAVALTVFRLDKPTVHPNSVHGKTRKSPCSSLDHRGRDGSARRPRTETMRGAGVQWT